MFAAGARVKLVHRLFGEVMGTVVSANGRVVDVELEGFGRRLIDASMLSAA